MTMEGERNASNITSVWRFCSEDYPNQTDLPSPTYQNPELYYYYDRAYGCYCYDYCPSFMANLPVYPAEAVAKFIYSYLSPIIFSVGLIGNTLILAMFHTKELRSMPSKPFFEALALTDNIALVSGFLVAFLREGNSMIDLRRDAASCKLASYSTYVSTCGSAWLVTSLTVDRFICVTWPMKAHSITHKHRLCVTVGIYIFIGLFYSHLLIYKTYDEGCYLREDDVVYTYFYRTYWTWMQLTANFLAPFCVIAFCNVGMVYSMKSNQAIDLSSTKSDVQTSKRLTRLFIVISTVFIITVLPINADILRTFYNNTQHFVGTTYREWALDILTFSLCKNSYYINHAINFLLYCLVGRKFRNALASVLWCAKV